MNESRVLFEEVISLMKNEYYKSSNKIDNRTWNELWSLINKDNSG